MATVPVVPAARVNHVGLCVGDLERSRHFYTEVFGFEPALELQPPDSATSRLLRLDPPLGMTAAYLKLDGLVLELLHFADATAAADAGERTFDRTGLTHLSLGVADLDEAKAAVVAHGGEVLDDTDLGMAVMVRDPDGQLLELLTGWTKP